MVNPVRAEDEITIKKWKSQRDPLDDVLFLMNQSSDTRITEEWLLNKLSWGRGGIGTIAYDQDLPIGLVLFGSAPYMEANHSTDVLLALYNYVSSDYRGRGIYNLLLNTLDEACEAEGFDLALIYPNSMARPGVRNNRWKALAPMQAYVHIPIVGGLTRPYTRLRKLMNSRNMEFVPTITRGLKAHDFETISSRREPSSRLQFAQSSSALEFRFNSLRGPGYHAVHGQNASAVVRVGQRGSVSEVQFMATSPSQINAKDWRELLTIIKKTFNPDMVSRIESTKRQHPAFTLASGFIKLRQVTIPFWKSFKERTSLAEPILTGIDIHTW